MSLPLFLQDRRFLQELDQIKIKQQFIKITVLNWAEEPLQEVQGIVINGSINIDGNSNMRRTGTLSIFAEEKDNNLEGIDSLFAINKKCILEIGIVNSVLPYTYTEVQEDKTLLSHTINYQEKYGDIVWFPLGLYIMFNPSISHGLDGVTIAMNLKDKMCLLNGDLGGAIHSSVDLLYQDEQVDVDSGSIIRKPTLMYDMIKELVHHWGNESLDRIIIEDVPLKIKNVMKWNGDSSIYMKVTGRNVYFKFDKTETDNTYTEIEPGYDIGYKLTDFVYPAEEFYTNIGDTVASVLDQVINVLGNFEYYYDVEGNFVFHEKDNSLNTRYTAAWMDEYMESADKHNDEYLKKYGLELPSDIYEVDNWQVSKPTYSFTYNNFVTSYNNTLNYNNIKNDFVVWGARTSSTGATVPCRYHLAIDDKPFHYKRGYDIAIYKDGFGIDRAVHYDSAQGPEVGYELFPWEEQEQKKGKIYRVYSAAYKNNPNKEKGYYGPYYPKHWRVQLYLQMLEDEWLGTGTNTELNNTYFQYYAEIKEQLPKWYNIPGRYYRINIAKHPDCLEHYIDFISESELSQYSVNNIGRRSMVVEDNEGINCVFEPTIPDVVFINPYDYDDYNEYQQDLIWCRQGSGAYIYQDSDGTISDYLVQGGHFNSCYEKVRDLLYQYTHMNNTVSLSCVPIYYLEPNTRITIEDDAAGIHGDFIIQSISLPLDVSSSMSINAYKALRKI